MTVEFSTGFVASDEAWDKYIHRKINQAWKILPMKEKNENWEKQAHTVVIELSGLKKLSVDKEEILLQILGKLQGLSEVDDIDFMYFRKTVFEITSLIEELK